MALNFELDDHWTGAGHQVAAEAIGSWLELRSGLIDARRESASLRGYQPTSPR